VKERAGEVVDQASKTVNQAYEQASQVVGETYDQAITYSRSNPGTAILIAFGAGVGIGLLVAAGMPARSRMNRIAEPVVGALSQIALEFIR
jgi:ABC-type nitrate/sulfonate/bicarbonate transport system permease component